MKMDKMSAVYSLGDVNHLTFSRLPAQVSYSSFRYSPVHTTTMLQRRLGTGCSHFVRSVAQSLGIFERSPLSVFSRQLSSLPAESDTLDAANAPGDQVPGLYTGPSRDEVLEMRKKHLSGGIFHFYKEPIMIVEGKMQYLFDDRGRRYLDAIGGIVTVSVGHCHPRVVEALERQTRTLQHASTIYLHPEICLYAKELTEKFPEGLDVAFFVNSGSEANDLAMLLARSYTGNFDVVSLRNSYHGLSSATMGLGGISTWKHPLPQGFGIHHARLPDAYRGVFGNDVNKYVQEIDDLILTGTPGKVAAFISEPIQGAGGSVPLLPGFLKPAYDRIRSAGGVCIADEVQTGFGRTGDHFWGFENEGVVPDIVTMAKGIGNGLPLAAVVTRREIADSICGKLYFNTFGGNPVVCAGGRAVLRAIEEDGLQENSRIIGGALLDGLKKLQDKHDVIGDVRGKGLMLGVELVKDRSTKEPAADELAAAMETLRECGVLVGKGGMHRNIFRIKPPMCLNMGDAEFLLGAMDEALSRL